MSQKWRKTGIWTNWMMLFASLLTQLEIKPRRSRRFVGLSMLDLFIAIGS